MDDFQKKIKKLQKKCLTAFDSHDIIMKSSEMNDKKKRLKCFEKKVLKKCLTKRVEHDKLIKSPKQGDKKFFEN